MSKPNAQIPIPQAAAACTAFAAFSVAIVMGIAAENPATTVLVRALVAMAAGFGGGFLVGLVCDWIVHHEIARAEARIETESAASADRDASEVGLDGLTGVDVIEDESQSVASGNS